MDFLANFKKFIITNANKNLEVISKSFGAMLIIGATAGISLLVQLVSGSITDYISPISLFLGAVLQFIIIVIRSVFGKKSAEEEPIEI